MGGPHLQPIEAASPGGNFLPLPCLPDLGGCSVGWGHRLDQAPTFLVTVWGDGWRGPAVCTDVKGCRGHVAQSPWNRPCHQVHTR